MNLYQWCWADYPCCYDDDNERYNRYNHRTSKNTPYQAYNCYGYAFGTYLWEDFFDFQEMVGDCEFDDELDELLDYLANESVLTTFPDYCIIDKDEVDRHKEVVAMRLGYNDFHFMVKHKNGQWYEKRGATANIHRVPRRVVFSDSWGSGCAFGNYTSKIIFFARNN